MRPARARRAVLATLVLAAACRGGAKRDPGGAFVLGTHDGCPALIALDADSVYFTTTAGVLGKVPKAGGTIVTLADGLARPGALAVDDKDVYVGTQGAVVKVPKAGGAATKLAEGLGLVTGLALDATYVTFVDFARESTLARVAKAGGMVERLQSVPGLVGHLAQDDASIYFVASHQLVRLPKQGGVRAAMNVTVEGDVRAADAKYVYLVDGHTLMRADKATGRTGKLGEALVVPDPFFDDKEAFWVDATTSGDGASRVRAVSLAGGPAREIAAEQPVPKAVAADTREVFWVNCGRDGRPGSIAKKAR